MKAITSHQSTLRSSWKRTARKYAPKWYKKEFKVSRPEWMGDGEESESESNSDEPSEWRRYESKTIRAAAGKMLQTASFTQGPIEPVRNFWKTTA